MPIPWGQHLDLARCAASIGEHDLGAGAVAMAGALHLLQRDLLIDSWTQKELSSALMARKRRPPHKVNPEDEEDLLNILQILSFSQKMVNTTTFKMHAWLAIVTNLLNDFA